MKKKIQNENQNFTFCFFSSWFPNNFFSRFFFSTDASWIRAPNENLWCQPISLSCYLPSPTPQSETGGQARKKNNDFRTCAMLPPPLVTPQLFSDKGGGNNSTISVDWFCFFNVICFCGAAFTIWSRYTEATLIFTNIFVSSCCWWDASGVDKGPACEWW